MELQLRKEIKIIKWIKIDKRDKIDQIKINLEKLKNIK